MGFARDVLTSPLRRARADTFAELVRGGPGPTLLEQFYAPYCHKLWALGPESLSGELFRRRVSATSAAALVKRVLRAGAREEVGFWYPRRGFGSISEALGVAVVAGGGTFVHGESVTALRPKAPWEVVVGQRRLEAEVVVSTIPAEPLTTVGGAPAGVIDAARVVSRGAILVYLVVPRPHYTPFDAHYFPERDVAIARSVGAEELPGQ